MATFQHPASLNALQQFGQACSILHNTTRASNPAWYQEALELNLQLHIRPDGSDVSAFYYDRKKDHWWIGPTLSEEILLDPTKLETVIGETLSYVRSSGASSLGVVLHIADDFTTTELKPELDNPASLPELKQSAVSDPASILEDSSIIADQASWRVLPYPAAGSEVIGTTVTHTRQYAPLLTAFRDAGNDSNFPIVTQALSAPLVAIMGLTQSLRPSEGKPFVAILQYPWFTAMAFFSEHSDLRLVRTLQHRGVRRATNFRNALTTTSASLEFENPDLFLMPLGQEVDTTLEANLRLTFTDCRVEVVSQPTPDGVPSWCPEPLFANSDSEEDNTSHTATLLHEEQWALQDFLPTPKEIVEIYPNRSEMALLRILRLSRVALFAITILVLAYFAFGVVNLIRQPEWTFNPTEATASESRLAKLKSERKNVEHWNNLLADRSKTWTAMESFSRMFPESGGMLVNNYSHTVKPDNTAGKARMGFIKQWKIKGYARDEALDYLNNLNTRDGINAHFSEVATTTGNPAFEPSTGNRGISINIRTQENNRFKPIPLEDASIGDSSTYGYTFDLTITQRFEATDPMALQVSKVR